MSVTDTFNRTDDTTLGANWTDQIAGLRISGNNCRGAVADIRTSSYYSASSWSNDQSSEMTIGALGSLTKAWCFVRMTLGSGQINGIGIVIDQGNQYLRVYVITNGSAGSALFDQFNIVAEGDTYKLSVAGTTYTVYKNGVQQGSTFSDSSFSSGAPGLAGEDSGTFIDSWTGEGEVVSGGEVLSAFLGEVTVGGSVF